MHNANHVKRNPATGEVAIRTIFTGGEESPKLARMEWLVTSAASGARHTSSDEVDDWDDLFVPESE